MRPVILLRIPSWAAWSPPAATAGTGGAVAEGDGTGAEALRWLPGAGRTEAPATADGPAEPDAHAGPAAAEPSPASRSAADLVPDVPLDLPLDRAEPDGAALSHGEDPVGCAPTEGAEVPRGSAAGAPVA